MGLVEHSERSRFAAEGAGLVKGVVPEGAWPVLKALRIEHNAWPVLKILRTPYDEKVAFLISRLCTGEPFQRLGIATFEPCGAQRVFLNALLQRALYAQSSRCMRNPAPRHAAARNGKHITPPRCPPRWRCSPSQQRKLRKWTRGHV